jgi:hypothetical protein
VCHLGRFGRWMSRHCRSTQCTCCIPTHGSSTRCAWHSTSFTLCPGRTKQAPSKVAAWPPPQSTVASWPGMHSATIATPCLSDSRAVSLMQLPHQSDPCVLQCAGVAVCTWQCHGEVRSYSDPLVGAVQGNEAVMLWP